MFGFLEKNEGIAVRHQQGSLTFQEFRQLLDLLGTRLLGLGVSPGDRVALLLPNSLELLAGFYACLLQGLVAVPINERLTPREVTRILDHSDPRCILTSPREAGRWEQAGLELAGEGGKRSVLAMEGIHRWLDEGPSEWVEPELPTWPNHQPGILFYTSGSTGSPKGVLYSHRTLRENSELYGRGMGMTPDDHSVLCHCMASNFVFAQVTVPVLDRGGTVEVVDFGNVEQTLNAIEAGATFLSLIPWFGFELITAAAERPTRANRLRACAVGGDRVAKSFFQEFAGTFGIVPQEHLGMTETNTFVCNPPAGRGMRIGSVGKPFPGAHVEIRGRNGAVLGPGMEGEIWVSSPGGMEGYWNDPERTAEVMRDGWIATGDSGYMDSDGYLWYAGRIKQIIICDGDNIHPKEVEQEILEHSLVARTCVVGVPHPIRGEVVGAAVVLKDPGSSLALEAMVEFLGDRLTEVKLPKYLVTLEEFPQMANGKVDQREVLRLLSAHGRL
jgi:long-chain acyl-CoA synthetase